MTYTNSEDQDQTAPGGTVWSGFHCLHSTKYFKEEMHKKQNLGQKNREWSIEILEHKP